jgi:drug/metabolite transporter (DMT)-like permease
MRVSPFNPWLAIGLIAIAVGALLIGLFIPSISSYIAGGLFALVALFASLRYGISVFQSEPKLDMNWSKDGLMPMSRLSRLLMALAIAVVGVYCFIRFSPLHTLDRRYVLFALALLAALVFVSRWLDMRKHRSSGYGKRAA